MEPLIAKYIYNKKYFKIYEFKKNTIIFNEGDQCDTLYYVIDGILTITAYTSSEKEEIIRHVQKDEYFGDILLFSSDNTFLGTGITETQCTIACIQKEQLLSLCKDSEFLCFFLNKICDNAKRLKLQTKLMCQKNIRDRIMFYFDIINRTNSKFVNITSVTNLSKDLNLPRPSVSRELSNMEKEGLIKKDKNIITLLYL